MLDFTGKTAMITGAGSEKGIGKETARLLKSKGATLILVDINEEGLKATKEDLDSTGGEVFIYKMDVTNPEEVKNTVKSAVDQLGKIDILVNNAGISRPTRILDIEEKEWDLIFNVNMKGVFFLTQAVLSSMKKNGYGRIVNLSSVSGKRGGGIFGGSHYSAAKAGVTGFTKAVARETAEFGITCNTVAPGLIGGTEITSGLLTEEKEKAIKESIPVGRVGNVDDVATAITFLVSEEAGYITGEELDINGGSHID